MTVFERVREYMCERCGCEFEDVTLAATFDELNIADFEREALVFLLGEIYEIDIPTEEYEAFETLEDLVGYIEDRF